MSSMSTEILHSMTSLWFGVANTRFRDKASAIAWFLPGIHLTLTLKEAGGGPKVPSGFPIGCHFSQDHAMVTKILDFIHIHPK